MAWYAAHAIMYFKLKGVAQERFTIWENVFLIESEDNDSAFAKAVEWAKREEGDSDGSLTVNDQPATLVFAGIRKLITVSHWEQEGKLSHGDEITYSEFQVSNEASIRELRNSSNQVLFWGMKF
jgi:hypothetical protein